MGLISNSNLNDAGQPPAIGSSCRGFLASSIRNLHSNEPRARTAVEVERTSTALHGPHMDCLVPQTSPVSATIRDMKAETGTQADRHKASRDPPYPRAESAHQKL